jgi:GntR family transcriptional regulator
VSAAYACGITLDEGGDDVQIPIRVSPDSPEPMYHQIEVQLRGLIVSGQLNEGTLLPSIREMALDLNCSVITIRRVYQDLENEGLLRTRQGTGTFVAAVSTQDKQGYRNQAVIEAIRTAFEAARGVQFTREEMELLLKQAMEEWYPNE